MRSRAVWGATLALATAFVLPGCTSQQRQGVAASYLVVDSLQAASGADPTRFGGALASDVLTKGTAYEDVGLMNLHLALRDPGSPSSPLEPSSVNYITVTRYHVKYIRTDGRNTQGVDVPYEFDGASTATVSTTVVGIPFTIVRVQAKLEAPLGALASGGGAFAISTIAEVTLYGTDQAGREVTVKGQISVTFADWADPVPVDNGGK